MAIVNKRFNFLCLIVFFTLLLSYPAFSQRNNLIVKKDSAAPAAIVDSIVFVKVDSMQVSYFTQSFDSLFLGKTHLIDTVLFNATYFDPLDQAEQIFSTLSNTGLANKALFFNPNNNIGFDMTSPANEAYLKTAKNIRFFNPLMPYSQINYTMGSKKEQQLGVSFAREFFPRVVIGMDYKLINSPGPYFNNKTNNFSVAFSGSYRTKNDRYGIAAYYFRNKLEQQENGGILDDSLFINNIETDRRVIDVALTGANNLIKFSGFGWEQYFNLSAPPKTTTDSLAQPKKRIQTGRIKHTFAYQRNQFVFTDNKPTASFYSTYDPLLDSLQTTDSTYVQVLRNSLVWNSLSYKTHDSPPPFFLYFGAEHAAFRLSQNSLVDTIFQSENKNYDQLSVLGGLQLNLFKSTRIFADAKLIVGGHQNGDWKFNTRWNQYIGTETRNLGAFDIQLNINSLSPKWIYNDYFSNHFRWSNNFERSNTVNLKASYLFKFLSVSVGQTTIDKYSYLDKTARPQQITGTLNIRNISGKLKFRKGKFDVQAVVYYQKPDIDSVLRLPEIGANLKFAFSQSLFDNAAVLQPGFNIRWFSAYYADAYMPALRSFYLQNETKVGNYPYLDVYLALKVKRANIYLQYANLLGLTGDFNYFTTPHYPMRDARFYFGVNWRFYK